ncbi:MAG: hypothetical protein QXT53_03425 [Ignisphaera sp.]
MSYITINVKIMPPFTPDMKSHELLVEISSSATILDVIKELSTKSGIALEKILDYSEDGIRLRDNVVVLVDGVIVDDLKNRVEGVKKIVLMPLAPGG